MNRANHPSHRCFTHVARAWRACLGATFAFTLVAFTTLTQAQESACVRDAYRRAQAQESCDPLYTAVGANVCAQTQCPTGSSAAGMLCLPRAAPALPAATAQIELLRVAVDLAQTQILAAGPAAQALAQARQTSRTEAASDLAIERASLAALDAVYAQLMPSMLSNAAETRPNRADLQQALGLRQRNELFTAKALAAGQQPDLVPVRLPACGDSAKRNFSSQKTSPATVSTPYAMAMASGAKEGVVLKPRADPQQCVVMRQGPVALLQLGSCAPLSPAHHLFLQANGRPLLAHGLGAPQCVRANSAGALYVSRCESAAPLPLWATAAHERAGDAPSIQIKLQSAEQCVTLGRDASLRLQPCLAPRASGVESQLFVTQPFKL